MAQLTKQQKRAKKLKQKKKALATNINNLNAMQNQMEEMQDVGPMYGPEHWLGMRSENIDDFDLLNLNANPHSCIVHQLLKPLADEYAHRYNLPVSEGDWVLEVFEHGNAETDDILFTGPYPSFKEAVEEAKKRCPDVKIFRSVVNGSSIRENVDYEALISAWNGDASAWEQRLEKTRQEFGYEFILEELFNLVFEKILVEAPGVEDCLLHGESINTGIEKINAVYNGIYKERLNITHLYTDRRYARMAMRSVESFSSEDILDSDIHPAPSKIM